MCTWLEETKRMNWTFRLIRPIPFHQPTHSLLLLLIVHTWWLKTEKKKYSTVHMTTLFLCIYIIYIYITWILRWHTIVSKEHTLIYVDAYMYIRSLYIIAFAATMLTMNTQKKEERRRRKNKSEEKRYVMVVISSRNYYIPTKQQKCMHV
jgi:hypothetical protein